MPTPRVIDLSHHNSIPKDLKPAAAAGIIGCIHKLTEGSSHIDSKVQARHFLAKEAGMAWGLYHFMRPGDMEEQAHFFVRTAHSLGVLDNATCVVADHEDEKVSGEELKLFLDCLEDLTRRSPVVYSGHVIKAQLAGSGYRPKRRLWLCQYCAPPPNLPEGVEMYWLWQYTDQGEIAGVTPPTDLNALPDGVEVEEFLAGWSGVHGAIPPSETAPVVTLSSNAPVRLHVGPNVTIV